MRRERHQTSRVVGGRAARAPPRNSARRPHRTRQSAARRGRSTWPPLEGAEDPPRAVGLPTTIQYLLSTAEDPDAVARLAAHRAAGSLTLRSGQGPPARRPAGGPGVAARGYRTVRGDPAGSRGSGRAPGTRRAGGAGAPPRRHGPRAPPASYAATAAPRGRSSAHLPLGRPALRVTDRPVPSTACGILLRPPTGADAVRRSPLLPPAASAPPAPPLGGPPPGRPPTRGRPRPLPGEAHARCHRNVIIVAPDWQRQGR